MVQSRQAYEVFGDDELKGNERVLQENKGYLQIRTSLATCHGQMLL